jgi:fumarate reductase subunit D
MLYNPLRLEFIARIAINNCVFLGIFRRLHRIMHHVHDKVIIDELATLHDGIHRWILLIT